MAPLRIWPGLAGAALLLAARFGLKAAVPGFPGFLLAMQGVMACAVAILVWWLFFSRAAWLERMGALGLLVGGLGATWWGKHESMGPAWMFAYAAPFALVGLVAAVYAGKNLEARRRRFVVACGIALSTLGWTLIRMEGIDGDHNATFAWRWSVTAEEQLLAKALPMPAAPAVADVPTPRAVPETVVVTPEWPGFRGPNRDSVVRGLRIATDWAQSPPREIWRKPVGPGWSSFAVQGGLLYTQEQRGEEELVTAYKAESGDLVWRHADGVRFFESNAGAGPRGTPTLANGRVYALGATGVLNALDAATGRRIWTRKAADDTKRPIPDWGFSASPVVTQGLVIVYVGRLAAYDEATGDLKWLGEEVGGSYSSPHLAKMDGMEQLLIAAPRGVASLDPATGKRLWWHEWPGMPIIQPALLPGGGVLISASQAAGTRRIDTVRGADGWSVGTKWTSTALKPYFNDTVIHKGHAYGFDARILACIDLDEGRRVWKGGRYGNGQMLLLADQDLLLVLSEDGDLALVEASPAGYKELAKMHVLEGKTWNHPVMASGLLFVRNASEMAAYRLPIADRSTPRQ